MIHSVRLLQFRKANAKVTRPRWLEINALVTSKSIKLAGSYVFGVIIAAILLRIVWVLKDSLAWLSLALGLAGGWAAGILLAPYQSEQLRFREYVKIASAFITGYGVSKLDRLFELWLDPNRGLMILSQAFAHRTLICITSFLWAVLSPAFGSWRQLEDFRRCLEHVHKAHKNRRCLNRSWRH